MDIGTNTKKYRAIHLKGLRRGQTQRYTELHMEGYKYGDPCKNTWGHTHKGTQGGSDTHGETQVPATFRSMVYVRPLVLCRNRGICICVDYKVYAAFHPSSDLRYVHTSYTSGLMI